MCVHVFFFFFFLKTLFFLLQVNSSTHHTSVTLRGWCWEIWTGSWESSCRICHSRIYCGINHLPGLFFGGINSHVKKNNNFWVLFSCKGCQLLHNWPSSHALLLSVYLTPVAGKRNGASQHEPTLNQTARPLFSATGAHLPTAARRVFMIMTELLRVCIR